MSASLFLIRIENRMATDGINPCFILYSNSDLSVSVTYNTVGNGLCNLPQGIEIRRWISEEMNCKTSYISDIFSCFLTPLAYIDCDGSRNGT